MLACPTASLLEDIISVLPLRCLRTSYICPTALLV